MHVLIVDNNAFVARGYMAMLKRAGHETTFEEGGLHAVKRMRELKPDVVILDLNMPDKDGFRVLEERWEDPELRIIPVVVVSSLEQGDLRERLKELHADDYLHKLEVSPAELVKRVESVVADS